MADRNQRRGQHGQAMVLMVGGVAAMIALLGLIVDGGNIWAQQRVVQNGSDAAAEAGAVVLAQKLAGASTPANGWDAQVSAQVQASATANGITITAAYYTDICGIPLTPSGEAALNADGTYDLGAADAVGSGALPATDNTTPNCPSLTVGPPAGVLVLGQKIIGTYLASVVGLRTVTVSTRATGVAGWLQGMCDASQGEACATLPVTIPVSPIACSGNGSLQQIAASWQSGQTYAVPLCKNDAGNVGWLDWNPPSGGTSQLIDSILYPDNPSIDLPSWQYVSQTGNVNSQGVQDAINTYDGQVVLIPMFDITCNTQPDTTQGGTAPDYGCPASSIGGNGQNQWYRFPWFAAFKLCDPTNPLCTVGSTTYTQGAYINGSDGSICGSAWSGAGCLVGQFVNIIKVGTVGANGGGGTSPTKVVGVQLIK